MVEKIVELCYHYFQGLLSWLRFVLFSQRAFVPSDYIGFSLWNMERRDVYADFGKHDDIAWLMSGMLSDRLPSWQPKTKITAPVQRCGYFYN